MTVGDTCARDLYQRWEEVSESHYAPQCWAGHQVPYALMGKVYREGGACTYVLVCGVGGVGGDASYHTPCNIRTLKHQWLLI